MAREINRPVFYWELPNEELEDGFGNIMESPMGIVVDGYQPATPADGSSTRKKRPAPNRTLGGRASLLIGTASAGTTVSLATCAGTIQLSCMGLRVLRNRHDARAHHSSVL